MPPISFIDMATVDTNRRGSRLSYRETESDAAPLPSSCDTDALVPVDCVLDSFTLPNGPLPATDWETFIDAVTLNEMQLSIAGNALQFLNPAVNSPNGLCLAYNKLFVPASGPQTSKLTFVGPTIAAPPVFTVTINVAIGLCVRASGVGPTMAGFTGYACKYEEQYQNAAGFPFNGATNQILKIVNGVIVQSAGAGTVRLNNGQNLELRVMDFNNGGNPATPFTCVRLYQNGIIRQTLTDNGIASGARILSGSPGVGCFQPGLSAGSIMLTDDFAGCTAAL